MTRGMYSYINESWRKQDSEEFKQLRWQRLIEWRKEPTVTRIERPTRLNRARELGYKAKPGFVIARTKVRRGSLRKSRPNKGRVPSKMGVVKITMDKSLKRIAEERTAKHYPNLEVLNSYFVGEDGKSKFYEVIMVDPHNPSIKSDERINWIIGDKNRVYRGRTSEGKKNRGLRKKGKRSVHRRPSVRKGTVRGK